MKYSRPVSAIVSLLIIAGSSLPCQTAATVPGVGASQNGEASRGIPSGEGGTATPTSGTTLESAGVRDPLRDTTLYTIGYSHLDTQWRWDYETTIRKYIPSTMLENFRLFEKYPGYTFNFSGANRYRMMKEYYPADFRRLKEYVSAGRWFPCGSSMEEADALVPAPESLIRNILYGNAFFRKEFGVASNEYLVPDCFGFPASMPTVLAHAGLKGFSTQKLTWGSPIGIPFNFGLWEGTDGSEIVAALNPGDYVTQVKENLSKSPAWIHRIVENGNHSGIFADFMYYGTGDIGGAPAEESVRWIEESMKRPGPIHVLSVPAARFFDDLTPEKQRGLPVYRGELLLTNHSAGSLTSQAYLKRWNRKNELLAKSAEASSVVAEWLGGSIYPREKLTEAWRLVLGAQFHDILAGTCTPRGNEFSWNDEVLALKQFGDVTADAIGAVTRGLNTQTEGIPLVVFNPLSVEREDVIKAVVTVPAGSPMAVRVFGPDGKEVPSQAVERPGNRRTILFLARVPPLGFSVYEVRPSSTGCTLPTGLRSSARSIENGRYRVTLNAAGDVSSIFDKHSGREMLVAPLRLEFLHERPLQYPAWNMDWADRQNSPDGVVDGSPTVRVVEEGPARVSLEIDRESRGSRFIQRIRLDAGDSGARIEFDTKIHWFTPGSSLKAAFPLSVSNEVATYNTGAGVIERGNNTQDRFEAPSHQWFDLTDRSGEYGISILEDSKFGSDKPADSLVRLTLLYTPGVRGTYKDQASQDFGVHEMLYALTGHRGDWRAGSIHWQAARMNEPLIACQAPRHTGFLGSSFSFLRISSPSVAVVALKKAEQGNDIIVRLLETTGRGAQSVRLSLAAPIVEATEVSGQEQHSGPATIADGSLVFDLTPYQLRAFALSPGPPAQRLSPPTSQPLPLPYTADVISATGRTNEGQFDDTGASLPAEMLPDSIVSEGILFRLGRRTGSAPNALVCDGQSLALPAGTYNRLYLLAASSAGDTLVPFAVDGRTTNLSVGRWSGFVGQWDNRIWDGYIHQERDYSWDNIVYEGLIPGFVKRGTVAYHTTHRHLSNGEDDPYSYAYLYKITVPLPPGAKTVTLPHARQVKILAATAARSENDATIPVTALHDTLNLAAGEYARFQVTPRPQFSPESCILDSSGAIRIFTKDETAEIYYTLDGTPPTRNSTRYSGPVVLDSTATVNAAAFAPGKNPSLTSTGTFYKAYPIVHATYLSQYSPKYPGSGDSTLTDGRRGTTSFSNPSWQGFEGEDGSLLLDLGRIRTVHTVTLGCLSDQGSWIFLPASISVAASQDGKTYGEEIEHTLGVPVTGEETGVRDLSVAAGGIEARYLRVTAKTIGRCPSWHPGAGGKAWLFLDEIIVE